MIGGAAVSAAFLLYLVTRKGSSKTPVVEEN